MDDSKKEKIQHLENVLASLALEEERLTHLYMTGKIDESTFDRLSAEWNEKESYTRMMLDEMKFDPSIYLDELEVALFLLANIPQLYARLDNKLKAKLLHIFVKKIIINPDGEIIDHKLHSPFEYLSSLANQVSDIREDEDRSTSVTVGTPTATRTQASTSGG